MPINQINSKPQRIQLSRKKGFRLQEYSRSLNGLSAVKVDRSNALFGNPHVVGKDGTIEECLALFEKFIEPYKDKVIEKLKGKNLACWCSSEQCHAEILLRIANEEEIKPPTFITCLRFG